MRSRLIHGFMLCLGLLLCPGLPAAVPDGTYVFDSSNSVISNTPIYDFSGTYDLKETFQLNVNTPWKTVNFPMQLVHDTKGKIHGTGTAQARIKEYRVQVDQISVFYKATGKVKSSRGLTVVQLRVKVYGLERDYRFQTKIKAGVETVTHQWTGLSRGHVDTTVLWPGRFKTHFHNAAELDLPPSTPYPWTLTLDILPDNQRLTGTGMLAWSSGRTTMYEIKGRYDPSANRSSLHLKGLPGTVDSGLKMKCTLSPQPAQTLTSFKGKLLGLKVRSMESPPQ